MDKIFQDAKDKYVTAVIVYGKTSDSKIYVDPEFNTQVDQSVVEDAFAKGVLMVKVGTASFRPVKLAGNKVTVAELSGSPAAATLTEYSAKAAG
jgi:hypothetical protein